MSGNSLSSEQKLPVMEHFYTIQGEGYYTGRAAYFVRLAGCDVGCVWCDVKESWDKDAHPQYTVSEIVSFVKNAQADFVVITGGEPAMHDLSILLTLLKNEKIETAIETSGCYELKGNVDWYCFSPKKFKEPVAEAYQKANELKVVIYHPSDILWAEGHAQKLANHTLKYLQPEWSKMEQNLPVIIDYVKKNPSWKISLQTHKFMDIP